MQLHKDKSRALSSEACGALRGAVRISGDKSISHRSVMFGAVANGITRIQGLLEGADIMSTITALRAMGAKIWKENNLWFVEGVGEKGLQTPSNWLDMGNSGTSTRLLAGLIAGYDVQVTLTGDASLLKRPMGRAMRPLQDMGAKIDYDGLGGDCLPVHIYGTSKLRALTYRLPVPSAQVKSAILLAALRAKGRTIIHEPIATRDHTEKMLRAFGAGLETKPHKEGGMEIGLQGPQSLKSTDVIVPADPSSAAFMIVAALLVKDSDITIPNVMLNPTRAGLIDVLRRMGGQIDFIGEREQGGEKVADLRVQYSPLTAIDVPPEMAPSMIDEYPILAVAAACANGTTRMYGLAELRVKESDRLAVVAQLLRDNGVPVETGEETLFVTGTGQAPRGGAMVQTHLDHRIAMSALVLGMASQQPVTIDDAEPISTSFPAFVDLMNGLGARITTA